MTVSAPNAPAAATWNEAMYTGRVCRCGHSEVCHWNGENAKGAERFDSDCAMCRGTCTEFRYSGRRIFAAVRRVVREEVQPATSIDELEPADAELEELENEEVAA
ncbi:MAG TPA: hypothetical protein VFS62_13920 [Chloroflexota bacterium]|nr:hypothetical protein [Chloroflexota bacterium]